MGALDQCDHPQQLGRHRRTAGRGVTGRSGTGACPESPRGSGTAADQITTTQTNSQTLRQSGTIAAISSKERSFASKRFIRGRLSQAGCPQARPGAAHNSQTSSDCTAQPGGICTGLPHGERIYAGSDEGKSCELDSECTSTAGGECRPRIKAANPSAIHRRVHRGPALQLCISLHSGLPQRRGLLGGSGRQSSLRHRNPMSL